MPVHPPSVDGGHVAFNSVARVALCSALLISCAHDTGSPVARRAGEGPDDDVIATVVAAQLPSGASACVVAQPRLVARDRRAWLMALSAAEASVWTLWSDVEVYAEAHQRSRTGAGATVRLLRVTGDAAAVQERLSRNPAFYVRWDEPPSECRPDRCVVSARWVAPNLVRLERGLWRERPSGVEARCVDMTREHPRAVEVAVRGPEELVFASGETPLVSTATRIEAGQRVVRIEQDDELVSVEAAELLVSAASDLLPTAGGVPGHTQRERAGNTVITSTELSWEDLRFSQGDRERQAGNRQYAERLMAMERDDGIDPRQRSHAMEQLRLRVALLEHLPVDAALLHATLALAERILATHPDDAECAFMLAALHVRQRVDLQRARALIERFLPTDPVPGRWTDLQRRLDAPPP